MIPTSNLVRSLLTDRYQLTMAYAYWKAGRHEKIAVFDLFFRKCPFGGEFAIFAGLSEAMSYVDYFGFTEGDISYLKEQTAFQHCEPEFFDWLCSLDASQVRIFAPPEGSAIFPRVPILRVEGPLAVCQLLETSLLNLINYPTLVATNAARFRLAAGPKAKLSEFGLRRAQGPDGALTASRSAYLGGFDTTSNELAGALFGIPVSGTHAHAYVQSEFPEDLDHPRLLKRADLCHTVYDLTQSAIGYLEEMRKKAIFSGETNMGELAAFLDYAHAFPGSFLALIDTYNIMQSGLINFLAVALALNYGGYRSIGVRIDSGDLSHFSDEIRQVFCKISMLFNDCSFFGKLAIVASNDINEETLWSLKSQGHQIDIFGIGTHLVTCQAQPALGGVYKLVSLDGRPCIKLSEEPIKTTIPGQKKAYRLYGSDGKAILDLMMGADEPAPIEGQAVLCRHPFIENMRANVIPSKVLEMHRLVWNGEQIINVDDLESARQYAQDELCEYIRPDHLRPLNPTPYKVSVSEKLYAYLHQLMQSEAPVALLT